MGHIVRAASQEGLSVTAGAWLDKNLEVNDQELRSLIELAEEHPNIEAAIIGNEAVLRGDLTVDELNEYLQRAQAALDVPVSTAETWKIWLDNPGLAEHVDFIAAHVLPYWEGVPVEYAPDYVFRRLDELQAKFPDKPIVLAEVGWPSEGQMFEGAMPGPANQEYFLREVITRAEQRDQEYFIIEAFDQPWKTSEGEVGGHWGVYGVHRQPKLDFQDRAGVLVTAGWKWPCALSTVFGSAFALIAGWRMKPIRFTGVLLLCLAVVASASALLNVAVIPSHVVLNTSSWFLWYPVLGALFLMLLITVTNTAEMTGLLWRRKWTRSSEAPTTPDGGTWPKVSLHVPVCKEPAEWCICEDAELGLRLLEKGYQLIYVPESYGRGIVPPSFAAYKSQRNRWAYGAAKILRHHWRSLLGLRRSELTARQRYHFISGWLPWVGDALHLVFTPLMFAWSVGMAFWPTIFAVPYAPLILPFLVVSIYNSFRIFWLYSKRVPCGPGDRFLAMLAGLSLVYTSGKGFLWGLLNSSRPFGRTAKRRKRGAIPLRAVWEELLLLALLLVAIVMGLVQDTWSGMDRILWVVALAAQAIPFAASVTLSVISSVSHRIRVSDKVEPSVKQTGAAHEPLAGA